MLGNEKEIIMNLHGSVENKLCEISLIFSVENLLGREKMDHIFSSLKIFLIVFHFITLK